MKEKQLTTNREIKDALLELREKALKHMDTVYGDWLTFADYEDVGFVLLNNLTKLINNIKITTK